MRPAGRGSRSKQSRRAVRGSPQGLRRKVRRHCGRNRSRLGDSLSRRLSGRRLFFVRKKARRAPLLFHVRRALELLAFACLPAALTALFALGAPAATAAWDFHAFWGAAANIDRGRSPYADLGATAAGTPYPLYLYPPLLAELLTPLGALPFAVAAALWIAASALALVAALRLLGVRDWRCYGLAFTWVPVLHGLRLGTLTPFLVLLVVLGRRGRVVGTILKLFLWPVLALDAARRPVRVLAGAAALTLASWAAVGFAGLTAYPTLLRRTQDAWERNGYGLPALAVHAGISPALTGALLLVAALGALRTILRLDPTPALACAVVLACLVSPVSWLHYSTLLLVPVALYQPRLGWAWALPLVLWLTPFEEADGSLWRVALWLAVMVATPVAAWRGTGIVATCIARTRRASIPASSPSSGRFSSASSSTSA